MDFRDEFQSRFHEIKTSLSVPDPKHSLDLIESLQSDTKRRIGSLPRFEQQKYETQLQQAREQVWKSDKPRRFKFKSQKSNSFESGKQKLSGSSPRLSDAAAPRRIGLVMELETRKSLTVRCLDNSIIFASSVESEVYLSCLSKTKVYIRCQQCRVHDCSDLEIFLEGCSNPVIENCTGIVFHVVDPKIVISDFAWPRSEVASPNYTILVSDAQTWKPLGEYSEEEVKSLDFTLACIELENK